LIERHKNHMIHILIPKGTRMLKIFPTGTINSNLDLIFIASFSNGSRFDYSNKLDSFSLPKIRATGKYSSHRVFFFRSWLTHDTQNRKRSARGDCGGISFFQMFSISNNSVVYLQCIALWEETCEYYNAGSLQVSLHTLTFNI